MATIDERVREVFSQILNLPEETDRNTTIESLGLDSLDVTEFVMELEEEFDITVDDDAVESWETVGAILDYVKENTQ